MWLERSVVAVDPPYEGRLEVSLGVGGERVKRAAEDELLVECEDVAEV